MGNECVIIKPEVGNICRRNMAPDGKSPIGVSELMKVLKMEKIFSKK